MISQMRALREAQERRVDAFRAQHNAEIEVLNGSDSYEGDSPE
jgi:hypothetical protein